jgi:hypothetical protein
MKHGTMIILYCKFKFEKYRYRYMLAIGTQQNITPRRLQKSKLILIIQYAVIMIAAQYTIIFRKHCVNKKITEAL